MTEWDAVRVRTLCSLYALGLLGVGMSCVAGGRVARKNMLPVHVANGFLNTSSAAQCEEDLISFGQARAYEKLAVADALLDHLTSEERSELAGYEWKEGTNDLSRVAGRAKWGLERILGVQLPNVLPTSTNQDLSTLRAQASRLVEGYRNGVIASAADRPVLPEKLADLKRRYVGKILPCPPREPESIECMLVMDELLGEWDPIGRKIDDLVSIVGAKGEPVEYRERGASGYTYRLFGEFRGREFLFIVREGIIRSVVLSYH